MRVSIEEMESLGFVTGFGDDRLRIGAIKMSIDGGLGADVLSIDADRIRYMPILSTIVGGREVWSAPQPTRPGTSP